MKKYKVKKHVILSIMGLLLVLTGILIIKLFSDLEPMIKTLPFLCVGLGAGIFGENLGIAVNNYIFSKNPLVAKKVKIEENDERNTIIKNKAKAKTYDIMLIVFGALMLAFALMGVELYIVITLVATYLLITLLNLYYFLKYQKQM